MLNLSATVAANSATRRAEADRLIAADATGTLTQFRDFVGGSAFSSNAFADKVIDWDAAGEILDTRRSHVIRAGGDVAQGLAVFAGSQGDWLARRQSFEDLWEHGRELLYGAVNAGGMGTEEFGDLCLVIIDPEAHRPVALGVFPGDSAQRYTTEGGNLDASAATREATSWTDRADLVLAHRASEAHAVDPQRWFNVVCSSRRYLEVVVAARLPVAVMAEVRVRQPVLDRLRVLRSRLFLGAALDPAEQHEVRAYDTLRRWRRAYGLSIQAVA